MSSLDKVFKEISVKKVSFWDRISCYCYCCCTQIIISLAKLCILAPLTMSCSCTRTFS